MIAAGTLPPPAATPRQRCRRWTSSTTTSSTCMSFIDPSIIKPFNVVLDAGSGMAGLVAPQLFERLPCRTTQALLRDRRHAFPTTKPIRSSKRTAATSSSGSSRDEADIGIAWDGDADRCFFIDGTGEFIAGDFVTALLAEAFLLQAPRREDRLRRPRQLRRQGHRSRSTAARR